MAEQNPSGWFQNAGNVHTAQQLRTYAGSMLAGIFSVSASTRTRGGVHPMLGGKLAVTQNGTPNMTVNVANGLVYIPGTESSAQAVYFCYSDTTVNLSIATAPGTGLNRIDLIVAQVQDSFYSTATNAWALAVVTGTAAASPSAPTAPNNSVTLAQVFVGANVTSIVTGNITDTRFYASALGGVIPCMSTARPSTSLIPESQLIYEMDTNILKVFDGSVYQQVYPPLLGIPVAPTTTSSSGTATSGTTETRDAVLGNYQFTAVAGRRYMAVVNGLKLNASVAGDHCDINIRNGGGGTPTSGSTLVANSSYYAVATGGSSQIGIPLANTFIPGAGTVTLGVFVVRNGGTGVFTPSGTRELLVYDIGNV